MPVMGKERDPNPLQVQPKMARRGPRVRRFPRSRRLQLFKDVRLNNRKPAEKMERSYMNLQKEPVGSRRAGLCTIPGLYIQRSPTTCTVPGAGNIQT